MRLEYSTDMLRFRAEVDGKKVQHIMGIMEYCTEIDSYVNFKASGYRYNYNITQSMQASYWIGIQHNQRKPDKDYTDMTIEYNPNKVEMDWFIAYVLEVMHGSGDLKLMSADIAVDMPIDIMNLKVYKRHGNELKTSYEKGSSDATYYYGAPGVGGRIKVYNKYKELKSKGQVPKDYPPFDLTRIEMTVKPKVEVGDILHGDVDLMHGAEFPKVQAIVPHQLDIQVTGADKIIMLACMEHTGYIDMLSRRKKAKIQEMIDKAWQTIPISEKQAEKTILESVRYQLASAHRVNVASNGMEETA